MVKGESWQKEQKENTTGFQATFGYLSAHLPYLGDGCSSAAVSVGISLAIRSEYFAKAAGMIDGDSSSMLR